MNLAKVPNAYQFSSILLLERACSLLTMWALLFCFSSLCGKEIPAARKEVHLDNTIGGRAAPQTLVLRWGATTLTLFKANTKETTEEVPRP